MTKAANMQFPISSVVGVSGVGTHSLDFGFGVYRDQSLCAGKPMTQPLLFLEGRLDKGFSGLDGQKFRQQKRYFEHAIVTLDIVTSLQQEADLTQLAIF